MRDIYICTHTGRYSRGHHTTLLGGKECKAMPSVTVPCKLAETYVCACHIKQTCITMRGRICTI